MVISSGNIIISLSVAKNQNGVGRGKVSAEDGVRGNRVRLVFSIFSRGDDFVKQAVKADLFDFFGDIERFFVGDEVGLYPGVSAEFQNLTAPGMASRFAAWCAVMNS